MFVYISKQMIFLVNKQHKTIKNATMSGVKKQKMQKILNININVK